MDILLLVLGIVCLILGFIGCILPMLPGPPLAYGGLLLLHFTSYAEFTALQLGIWLALVVVAQVLDYIVPMLGSRYSGGSQWGERGALGGTLLGLLFMPWGIVVGPFLGAIVGELMGGRSSAEAVRSGIGSLVGFVCGTLLKCILCGYFCWKFIEAALL